MRVQADFALKLPALAALCCALCAVAIAGPVGARDVDSARADDAPVNLVPWESPKATGTTGATSRLTAATASARAPMPLRRLPQSYALYAATPTTDRPKEDEEIRLTFGRFNSPIGSFSLVSRELDQYGRVRSVELLAFDDPNSRWDMNVQIRDGAMFQIKRRWGGGPAPGRMVGSGNALPPDLH